MKSKIFASAAVVLVVAFMFIMNLGPSVPAGYEDLDARTARTRLAASPEVHILDVRTPGEYRDGHINGAENLDFYADGFEHQLSELDRDGRYFVYCRTGNRSYQVVKIMHRLGFKQVWHLTNGIVEWKGAGYP